MTVIILNLVILAVMVILVRGNGNSDGNVDSSISGNSVEFSNSCECGASGESGSSVDSDKSFNFFNRQKSKFKICGR